jgi:outer membrane protein assembly factor BamE (lipoprotein component of BamABCDE complex)
MKNTKLMVKSLLLVCCLLTCCVSNRITWSTNDNIKKIALGMSKDQVVAILGKDYLVASSSKDDYGKPIEILAYKSDVYEEYKLKFVNAQLTEWNREYTNKYIVKDPTP